MSPQEEEKYKTRLELIQTANNTWEVREINIFTYDNPLAARNKAEEYMYRQMETRYGSPT